MCKKNKSLADFADFVKQIEFDEYGNPTNLQYNIQYGAAVWVNIVYFDYVTYLNYVNDKIRIKPKMRWMTVKEIAKEIPCIVLRYGDPLTFVDVSDTYVTFYDVEREVVLKYQLRKLREEFTRLDGTKFEVEDV